MDQIAEQELCILWRERGRLDQAGWSRLYERVFQMLRSGHCPELASLPLPRDDYIQDFFTRKVFEPIVGGNTACGELKPAGALVTFFRNYLRDRLREADLRHRQEPSDDDDNSSERWPDCRETDLGFEQQLLLLQEATGLDVGQVADSARRFLENLPDWARLYLKLNTCADHADAEPIYKLSDLYNIASHHYKARHLGITRKKGEFEQGYEHTLLGGWLVSLGLEPSRENAANIETAFKILCREALNQKEPR